MQNFISMQQMYQSWLDIANRVEQVTAKLDSGIDVADTNVKSELEAIKAQLNGTLAVNDAGLLAELTAVKAKLEAIEARLDKTLDVQLTGSKVGYSTEEKPTNASAGDDFIELDTGNVYIYDGSKWVMLA